MSQLTFEQRRSTAIGIDDVQKFINDGHRESNHLHTLLGVHVLAQPLWAALPNLIKYYPEWCQYFRGEYNQNLDNIQLILTTLIRQPGHIFMQLNGWVMEVNQDALLAEGWSRCPEPRREMMSRGADIVNGFSSIFQALFLVLDDGNHAFYHKWEENRFIVKVVALRSPLMYQVVTELSTFVEDNAYIKEQAELLKGNSKQT